MNKVSKCLAVTIIFTLLISIVAIKPKADSVIDIKPNTELHFDYNYLKYIAENPTAEIGISDTLTIMYITTLGTENPFLEPVKIFINRGVYTSSYNQIFVYNDDALTEPLNIFVYSESLGEYIFNIYDDSFSLLNSIPFSDLSIENIEWYAFKTTAISSEAYPYLKTRTYLNSDYTFNSNVLHIGDEYSLIYLNQSYFISGVLLYPIELNGNYYTTFNSIRFDTNKIFYNFNFNSQEIEVLVYNNGWLYDNARYLRVYDSSININLNTFLLSNGVLRNTYQVESSDMKDLIFAYADIPYKIISSMTSFEILGFTFFAILGTIILIIIVIKVIKKV